MAQIRKQETIAVIGGGITGITSALELAKTGHYAVTLFEKKDKLGGLSSYYQWRDIICDRFYHVILSTDRHLLDFIRELNLESEIYWKEVKSGFYGKEKLVSLSSTSDFLKFPLLSFWQKTRMGFGIIYSAQIRSPARLSQVSAEQWLIKVFGSHAYANIWEPLLNSKLGNARERVPATFIWSTIKRLYGTRSLIRKQEKMGYVRGGYHAILSAAERRLSDLNVKIATNTPIIKVGPIPESQGISVASSSGESQIFDKVLFTIPSPEIYKILEVKDNNSPLPRLADVEYLGVLCVLLILSRQLSPYYVINLLDNTLPFTGIIESTNVISTKDPASYHLVYLPKYLSSDDPANDLDDARALSSFVSHLKKLFPYFQDEQILHTSVFRERYVQPLQEIGLSEATFECHACLPSVYLSNSSMIYASTLNNNAVIDIANQAVRTILEEMMKSR
jgi:protoporphyrinogen oxidase